ncbi:MAG TPA: hypothetical protein VFE58_09420 [Tepidisphaeraceae bacterium]|nr:hypothetical protein [Tepidisphaeraceae bacterium]
MARPKSDQPAHRCQAGPNGNDRGFVVLSGERKYTGKWGTEEAKATYLRYVSEWIARGRKPSGSGDAAMSADALAAALAPAGSALTISQFVAAYWIWCKQRYAKWLVEGKPTGELDNIRQALKPLNRLYGPSIAVKFGCPELKAIRAYMIERKCCRKHHTQGSRDGRSKRPSVEEKNRGLQDARNLSGND